MSEALNTAAGPSRRTDVIVIVLTALGLTVAGLAAAARLSAELNRPPAYVTVLHVLAGVAFLVTGCIAALRQPRNRVGLLMMSVGITWFVIDLQFVASSLAFTLGNLFGIVTWGFLAMLVLAFPSGRLDAAIDKLLVAAVFFWMIAGNVVTEILYAPPAGPTGEPHQLFVLHSDAAQNQVANRVQLSLNIALGAAVLLRLFMHWTSASTLGRRALAPAVWSSAPIFAVVLALDAVGLITYPDWLTTALPALTPIALMTLPIAFLAGQLRASLARLAIGHLVVELGEPGTPERFRDMLARAVRDPSLTVAYRLSGNEHWVDAAGQPVTLPSADARQAFTLLARDGDPIAAVIHDRVLNDDPALITSVAAAASLALDRERLEAEVRAQLSEVRSSRRRIMRAADAERRRLQRDLHDGAQQRLVALTMRVAAIRDKLGAGDVDAANSGLAEATSELQQALVELRQLSSGIHPAILVEAGLGPALQSLADVAALPVHVDSVPETRLPEPIETAAYFAVSESLANAAKHAQATSVHVRAQVRDGSLIVSVEDDGIGGADSQQGSGLAGLADRVAALNGRLTVDSPARGGTRVRVELPCA